MSEDPGPDKTLPRVAVLEAVNDSLKETFLGTTAASLPSLAAGFAQRRPRAVSHWAPKDRISMNIVEAALSEDDARDFIRHYAASLEAAGWKPLREDS
ncbi:MAG: hypothetical protein Q8T11_03800 [Elusimicrobiota bacterium]|nr:hypothetical protein [Elusimicrobiota bacterium]